MKKLFAGPFVGEFGHELFCWQGKIRRLSEDFEHTTVSCMPGKEVLYKDFADEIITYQPQTYIPDCSWNRGITNNYPIPDSSYDVYIPPNKQIISVYDPDQKFVPYGEFDPQLKYDFIFAARKTKKNNSGHRDWSHDKWDE